MKEFVTALDEQAVADGTAEEEERYVEFGLDGRTMRAYQPHEGQLAFMMASLGRGQTSDQRFAAVVNVMLSSLRDDDRDYMESRLLTRDKSRRLPISTIEGIFSHLTEEWFRSTVPDDGAPVLDRG